VSKKVNNPTAKPSYIYSGLLEFWTLSIVRSSKNYRAQRLGNWICFRPQVRWLRLAPSEGPNRVGVFPPSPSPSPDKWLQYGEEYGYNGDGGHTAMALMQIWAIHKSCLSYSSEPITELLTNPLDSQFHWFRSQGRSHWPFASLASRDFEHGEYSVQGCETTWLPKVWRFRRMYSHRCGNLKFFQYGVSHNLLMKYGAHRSPSWHLICAFEVVSGVWVAYNSAETCSTSHSISHEDGTANLAFSGSSVPCYSKMW
jgi:hypothetical protein